MKTMKFLGFAIALLLLPLGFAACSDDDKVPSSNESSDYLIGTWYSVWSKGWEKEDGKIVDKWDEAMTDEQIEIQENGRFNLYYENNAGAWWLADTGTWEVNGSKLIFAVGDEEETYKIEKLTSTELVLTSHYEGDDYEDEETVTFRKMIED